IASAETCILCFLCEDQSMQAVVHRVSIWYSRAADKSGECWRNLEFHGSRSSAKSYRKRESGFAGFLVLTVHVLVRLSHGRDGCVQTTAVYVSNFLTGNGEGGPGLDSTEYAPLDTRNLNVAGDGITGHSQMMFQCRLRRVLDDSWVCLVCRRNQCRGHRRRYADLSLAPALAPRHPSIVFPDIADIAPS